MEVLTDLRTGSISPIQTPSLPPPEPICYPLGAEGWKEDHKGSGQAGMELSWRKPSCVQALPLVA